MLRKAIKKVLYALGYEISIDWKARYTKLGADSVYDTGTVKSDEQGRTTSSQVSLYSKWLNAYMMVGLRREKILDFGCGIGRHHDFLRKCVLESPGGLVHGYDPTPEILGHAESQGYDFLSSDKATLDSDYDLVFVHMVLGGLRNREFEAVFSDLAAFLKPQGLLILIEAVDDTAPRLYETWKVRGEQAFFNEKYFYDWVSCGSLKEQSSTLKMMIGRRR